MHPLIGVLLFFVGGGVGYYVGHSIAKIKCAMAYDEEVRELEEYYLGKHPEKKPRNASTVTSIKSNAGDTDEIQSINCKYEKPAHVDYHKKYNSGMTQVPDPAETEYPQEDEDDVHDKDVGEFISSYNKRHRNDPPRVISASEHGSMEDYGYTTMELTYYQGNDTLVESDPEGKIEEMIYPSELDDMVGNTLIKFGFKFNDEEVMYVRNFARMVDYEIHKKKGSFGEEDEY